MYKAIFKEGNSRTIEIGKFDDKESAIDACVKYKMGHFSCDTPQERRIGLTERGWAIIGYTNYEVSIEEES